MAVALYLKADGVDGSSQDSGHKGWSDLKSYRFAANQQDTADSGPGLGAGRAEVHDLTCTAAMDKAYPTLFSHLCTGKHIPKVTIEAAKAGGDQMVFLKYTLEDVMVTSCHNTGVDGAEMVADYSFKFAKVKAEFTEQTDKGAKGAAVEHGWNVKENKKL